MDSVKHVVIDGIPVDIDTADFGRVSVMKLMGVMHSSKVADFERCEASIAFAERVLGEEQYENVCRSLDPDDGDPDFRILVDFVDRAIKAAAPSEDDAKN